MDKQQRKANNSELRLRELAIKALDSVRDVLKYSRWAHHTKHIAFNCKVHGYITVDDVKDILRKSKMSFRQYRTALNTFDSRRIENIYYHIIEQEADGFKDWAAGRDYTSKMYVRNNIERYLVDFPYSDARPQLARKKSEKAKRKFIFDFFKKDFEALDKLALIHDEDVFRIGRSGGHFAIAEADVFDGYEDRIQYFLDKCYSGDNIILDSSIDSTTHSTWMDKTRSYYECSSEDLKAIIEHCQAVEFVIEHGLGVVKQFGREYFLTVLMDEIQREVGEFEMITDEEQLQAWTEHRGTLRTNPGSYTYLRVSKDRKKIETSQGVAVSIEESKALFKHLVKLDPNELTQLDRKISHFHTNSFGTLPGHSEPVFVAGCHKFKWSFIQEFYTGTLDKLAA